jgi:hypothetical protein
MSKGIWNVLALVGLALLVTVLTATGPPAEMSSETMFAYFDQASAPTPALATFPALLGDCATSALLVQGLVVGERRHFSTITLIGEVPPARAETRPRLVPAVMTYTYTGHETSSDRNLRRLGPAQASTATVLRV